MHESARSRRIRAGGVALGALVLACGAEGEPTEAGSLGANTGGATTAAGSPGSGATAPSNGGTPGTSGAGSTGTSQGGSTSARPDASGALESVARRLSRAELDNVLEDVLGDDTSPAHVHLLEEEYTPFDNDAALQTASQAYVDGLAALAEDVARRAISDPARRSALVPCTPTGPDDAACFRSTIETLGQRLFRRPLASDEVDRYLALQEFATEDVPEVENDFYTAVELFLRAALLDPEFLYRIEVGTPTATPDVFALDDLAIASRLSFLIQGSTPDSELLADAAAGRLTATDGRRAAALRLLETERARTQLHRYHAMWLGYRAIPHPAELARAFHTETTALLDRVLLDDPRSYLELFTFPETFLDRMLADHYGLPRPDGDTGWVDYGASGRAGILSHGSVLSSFSKFSDTSPTQRGIFVRTRLLCEEVPPPPPTVDVDQPPGADQSACKEARYAEHRAIASCASCHDQIDPIGFGLEQFDVAGRFRTHDDGMPSCTIQGTGDLPGLGSFSGPAELGELLVSSGRLDACAVRQYLTFALGRKLAAHEQPFVDALVEKFRTSGHRFPELVLALVEDPSFALRKEPLP